MPPSLPIAYDARARRRERLAWVALPAWLLVAGATLGYFTFKDQKSFEPARVTLFDVQDRSRAAERWLAELSPSVSPAAATVVNFMRPACDCNRFTSQHLLQMRAQYEPKGIRFIDAEPPKELAWIASAPAALVFDARGALVYFGPYSSAAWCATSGGLVESVLNQVLLGKHLTPMPMYVSGCFCNQTVGV